MGTFATPNWYERDGERVNMTGGRDGRAEAAETSPNTEEFNPEVIGFAGTISEMNVCTGDVHGRYGINRPRGKPLAVTFQGQGRDSAESVLRSARTGEKYQDFTINRQEPAIAHLGFVDMRTNVIGGGPYPIVTGEHTVMGTFRIQRTKVYSSGPWLSSVKTVFRSNAYCRDIVTDVEALDGVNEYLYYGDFGSGGTRVKRIRVKKNARGAVQCVNRYANVGGFGYDTDQEEARLSIEGISAVDTGSNGSSVVSVTGWGDDIRISDINCDTRWNTAVVALRFDPKQCEVTGQGSGGSGGNWKIQGPGRMFGPHSHGSVVIDLSGNVCRTGRNQAGQAHKAHRGVIIADSTRDLWLASNESTSIKGGAIWDDQLSQFVAKGPCIELENNGSGPIYTYSGSEKVGTRKIKNLKMVGDFSGWEGAMRRVGQPFSPDEYRSNVRT